MAIEASPRLLNALCPSSHTSWFRDQHWHAHARTSVGSRRTSSPVALQLARGAGSAFEAALAYTITVSDGGGETETGARHLLRWKRQDASWGF